MNKGWFGYFVLILLSNLVLGCAEMDISKEEKEECNNGDMKRCFLIGAELKNNIQKHPIVSSFVDFKGAAREYLSKSCEGGFEEACTSLKKLEDLP